MLLVLQKLLPEMNSPKEKPEARQRASAHSACAVASHSHGPLDQVQYGRACVPLARTIKGINSMHERRGREGDRELAHDGVGTLRMCTLYRKRGLNFVPPPLAPCRMPRRSSHNTRTRTRHGALPRRAR